MPQHPSLNSTTTRSNAATARRFDDVEEAIASFSRGEMVILADDEDRENEGDLVCAAELVTPAIINFMATHGRGLICLALHSTLVNRLDLPLMTSRNTSRFGTNFTVSIEAREGVSTGISAADRAHTIRTAIAPNTTPDDISIPGHVFPLRAKDGGVLVRAGQTEGSVDLARLANLSPAGVLCEIMDEDGSMARYQRLRQFADTYQLKYFTISDLIAYRKRTERQVERVAQCNMPTAQGDFLLVGYRNLNTDDEYTALVLGEWGEDEEVLVRVHSQCLTGDVFGSLRCDCGSQLKNAMQIIQQKGKGVVLYLPQEGRGIGLLNKIKAYKLQEEGADTVEANHRLGFGEDLRDYGVGAQILHDLGLRKLRLLTNNPRKIVGLSGHGLSVVGRMPIEMQPTRQNQHYLKTKKNKLGHLLSMVDDSLHS